MVTKYSHIPSNFCPLKAPFYIVLHRSLVLIGTELLFLCQNDANPNFFSESHFKLIDFMCLYTCLMPEKARKKGIGSSGIRVTVLSHSVNAWNRTQIL